MMVIVIAQAKAIELLEKRREALVRSYAVQIDGMLNRGDEDGLKRVIGQWQRLTGAINTAIIRLRVKEAGKP